MENKKFSSLNFIKKHTHTLVIGNIYTASDSNDFVESMIIEEDTIVFIGKVEESHSYIEEHKIPTDKLQRLKFKLKNTVIPGFVDSHVHPYFGGLAAATLNLSDCKDLGEALHLISEHLFSNPQKQFIYGIGYKLSFFSEDEYPHAKLLDRISSKIPMAFISFDGNSFWCNSALMKLAGITKNTVSPKGGVIDKDKHGNPTGVFHNKAMILINKVLPKVADEDKVYIVKETLKEFVSLGITSFMDAAVNPDHYFIYKQIYSDKDLVINLPRCSLSISVKSWFFDQEFTEEDEHMTPDQIIHRLKIFFKENRIEQWNNFVYKNKNESNKLLTNAVKLFIDGMIESEFSYSNCKYWHDSDICSEYGIDNGNDNNKNKFPYSQDQLNFLIDYLYKNNFQIHTHCKSDLSTQMVLNAIEYAQKNYISQNSKSHYLAHLQLVSEDDIFRMKSLGVYAIMSPFWFKEDKFSIKQMELDINNTTKKQMYPVKTLLQAGIKVGFSSDWPMFSLNPLDGIEVAVTHRELGVELDRPAYNLNQQISVFEAVKAYTIGSAEILNLDSICGTFAVGKKADLVVLDRNIFEINAWEIHNTAVILTMIDGLIVYKK